jgi:hypothetical protein
MQLAAAAKEHTFWGAEKDQLRRAQNWNQTDALT